jgi:type I restriction enzyme, R subunit
MPQPEQQARERIDAMLQGAGWAIQDMSALNPYEGLGVAVREYPTDAGPCDYMLYVGGQPCGVIEAKKVGTTGRLPAMARSHSRSSRSGTSRHKRWSRLPMRSYHHRLRPWLR